MQNLAVRAIVGNGFRLTLDLSAWANVGVNLGGAILRIQAQPSDGPPLTPAPLEFSTGGANPVVFNATTGLAWFAAPALATAALAGRYSLAARAEFSGYELPLFAGAINFSEGVASISSSSALPVFDTAWISAHPFGPAPVPAPIADAIVAANAAVLDAIRRAIIYA